MRTQTQAANSIVVGNPHFAHGETEAQNRAVTCLMAQKCQISGFKEKFGFGKTKKIFGFGG